MDATKQIETCENCGAKTSGFEWLKNHKLCDACSKALEDDC